MESSGNDINYWPGFVDALSNVVLTLIFVLVVFVFALVMASSKVEQKYKEILDAHIDKAQSKENPVDELKNAEVIMQKLTDAEKQIKILQAKLDENQIEQDTEIEVKDTADAKVSKAIIDGGQKNKISLKFSTSIVNMDEESQEKLTQELEKYKRELKDKKLLIRAYLDGDTYSVGQRLSYYRILEVRNFLISKSGVLPAQISSKIIDGKGKKAGYVEILFNQE